MKTNPEALKKLYVAMGGNEEDVADISLTPDMIEALADIYEGGGGASAEEFALSVEDMTTFRTAIGQFLAAALQASGAPTKTSTNASFSVYADVMSALGDGSIVSVATTTEKIIVAQHSQSSFVIRANGVDQQISEGVYADFDVAITVSQDVINFFGYAAVRA